EERTILHPVPLMGAARHDRLRLRGRPSYASAAERGRKSGQAGETFCGDERGGRRDRADAIAKIAHVAPPSPLPLLARANEPLERKSPSRCVTRTHVDGDWDKANLSLVDANRSILRRFSAKCSFSALFIGTRI